MNKTRKDGVLLIILFVVIITISGCQKEQQDKAKVSVPEARRDLKGTIGSYSEIFSPDFVGVEGFGIVAGLNGSGSLECPANLRSYFNYYIPKQTKGTTLDIERFLNSQNTAVVQLRGKMPTVKGEKFDVEVISIEGSQTTSLEGGWLFTSELKTPGNFSFTSKNIAVVSGAVFIDPFASEKTEPRKGVILGGGTVLKEYPIRLLLKRPEYVVSNAIRNKLILRFGEESAQAVSPSLVEVKLPVQYMNQKHRFIEIIKSMDLSISKSELASKIEKYSSKLARLEDSEASEISLETIGKESLGHLYKLSKSESEEVRLRSGRCMLNMGDNRGFKVLQDIVFDRNSTWRWDALDAITKSARRSNSSALSRRLLRDPDFETKLWAYKQLRKLDDVSILRYPVGKHYLLEQLSQSPEKAIYVSRMGVPRIVLFGSPIYCRENIFIQSRDGRITINAPKGQKYVSIIYKSKSRPELEPLNFKSSYELSDILLTLSSNPSPKSSRSRTGLGIGYSKVIELLKQMSERGALMGISGGDFHIGESSEPAF